MALMIVNKRRAFINIAASLQEIYTSMPQDQRRAYLCYIKTVAFNLSQHHHITLTKKDFVLIPKRSKLHRDFVINAQDHSVFRDNHFLLGSLGYLFTFDADRLLAEFEIWNQVRIRISMDSFRLSLNQIKKICHKRKSSLDCCYLYDKSIDCACEEGFRIKSDRKAQYLP